MVNDFGTEFLGAHPKLSLLSVILSPHLPITGNTVHATDCNSIEYWW